MNFEQLSEKIDKRMDRFDEKLDAYSERVVRVEEKYNSMSGQVKLVFALLGAVFTGIISYLSNIFSK